MQLIMLAGNVGKDAVIRTTQSGEKVLSFSLAIDNGKDKNGNRRDSTWYECSLWGKRAESLHPHITKGSKITLTGRPTARAYEGKAYLGVSVDDLTLMGGGQREHVPMPPNFEGTEPAEVDRRRDGFGAGGRAPMDDEIPFAPEMR